MTTTMNKNVTTTVTTTITKNIAIKMTTFLLLAQNEQKFNLHSFFKK